MRSFAVASLTPLWDGTKGLKRYLSDRPFGEKKKSNDREILQLRFENRILQEQVKKMTEWLAEEQKGKERWEVLQKLVAYRDQTSESHWRDFFQRRAHYLRDLLQREWMALPAQIIYRDPSFWSSSLWLGIGEEDNRSLGKILVAKNSPVVAGSSLVGVIDFVGKRQSRVRLLTDSGLSPAVRAVRGASQDREIASLSRCLLQHLERRKDLAFEQKEVLLENLRSLKNCLSDSWEEAYLAKGEIRGSSASFWRSRAPLLKGVGFNFDYEDREGEARPLSPALLKEGDLLVTSGFDGVFPPDLLVGNVVKVQPLREGEYSYEIEVSPAAPRLNDIQILFVLPPLGGE